MAPADRVTVDFAIWAPLREADLPGLCDRVCRLLQRDDPVVVFCDVRALEHADTVTVDALARLQLVARRRGAQVRLRHASADLRQLVTLMGLQDVLPGEP